MIKVKLYLTGKTAIERLLLTVGMRYRKVISRISELHAYIFLLKRDTSNKFEYL